MLAWVVLSNESGFAWETWLLIDIGRVGLKISVGLVETIFYKKIEPMAMLQYCNRKNFVNVSLNVRSGKL